MADACRASEISVTFESAGDFERIESIECLVLAIEAYEGTGNRKSLRFRV